MEKYFLVPLNKIVNEYPPSDETPLIIIDALDEAVSKRNSERIIKLLNKLITNLPKGVKIITTSRSDVKTKGIFKGKNFYNSLKIHYIYLQIYSNI